MPEPSNQGPPYEERLKRFLNLVAQSQVLEQLQRQLYGEDMRLEVLRYLAGRASRASGPGSSAEI